MEYKKHRFNIYPEMQPEEFERLRANIFANGYDKRYPIWLFEGEIIDGWNRYRACDSLGIEPYIQHFEGSAIDAMQLVVRSNDRRDLNSSQRAMIAIEAEEIVAALKAEAKARHLQGVKTGGEIAGNNRPKDISYVEKIPQSNPEQNKVRTQLAETFGTNPRYISDAFKLKKENPEIAEQVKAGKKTLPEVKKEQKFVALKQAQKEKELTEIAEAKNVPTISLADCRKYLYSIQDQSIDLILTDPPYLTEFEKSDFGQFIESWLYDLLAKLKPTGRAFICTGAYPDEMLIYLRAFQKTDFIIDAPLIWTYRNTLGQTPRMKYNLNYQLIWHLYRNSSNELDTSITNEMFSIQDINAPDGRQGNRLHTWQKPDELANRLVRHASKPGDKVLDIFACTGTFLLAAAKAGRQALGCEINSENIKIAEGRGCKIG
jgi:DNA modification methylase